MVDGYVYRLKRIRCKPVTKINTAIAMSLSMTQLQMTMTHNKVRMVDGNVYRLKRMLYCNKYQYGNSSTWDY